MSSNDLAFAGSMPALYDRYLGAMLFEPYAADIAARLAVTASDRLVEVAAGTGIVTQRIAAVAPGARIEATDLSDAMVAHAAARSAANVRWSIAEMRRVLKTSATFALNVWDGIAHNDVARIVSDTVATTLPMERPTFLERVPHGHGDPVKFERDLRETGFETVTVERVGKRSTGTARDAAMERTIEAVTKALRSALGGDRIDGAMHAFVFSAR